MATARIESVGPNEYGLIRDLYNQMARPAVDIAYFQRRLQHKHNVRVLVAELDGKPVGFAAGYELRPSTYYGWLYGVLPDARRLGVGAQLMAAMHAWAKENGYEMIRFECYNQHKGMIQLTIGSGYDIVGIRYDSRTCNNLVIFERHLHDEGHEHEA